MPIDGERFEAGEERYSIENEIVHFLHEHRDRAYNVHEVAVEVMEPGWSEANVEADEFQDVVGCFLDLATVSSILDSLVDDGGLTPDRRRRRRGAELLPRAVRRRSTGAVSLGETRERR